MTAKGYSKGKAPPPPPMIKRRALPSNRLLKVVLRQGLCGAEFQLDIWSENSVKIFKERISRILKVPVLCQKLMVEAPDFVHNVGTFLCDCDRLSKYVHDDASSLRVVVVVSDEDACSILASVDASTLEERMHALGALSQLALQGSDRALNAIISCVEDDERLIRLESARSLSEAAKQGNRQAVAALGLCVGFDFQDDLNPATAATEALSLLVSQGNEIAWTTVDSLLGSADPIIKREAIKIIAIAALFYKSSSALASFSSFLECGLVFVREAAVAGVAFAASVGDSQAVSLLCSCLDDTCLEVRRSAIAGLGMVAMPADDKVVSVLLKLLQDHVNRGIQDVALAALAKVAGRGGRADVIEVVCSLVEDPHGSDSALVSLAKVADKGCDRAIRAIYTRVKDADWNVRGAAIAAATKLTCCTDVELLNLLRQGACDSHADVRIVSLTGLGYCAYQGHDEPLAALKARLEDEADARVHGAIHRLVHCIEKMRAGDPVSRRVCRTLMDQVWSQWGLGSIVLTPREH